MEEQLQAEAEGTIHKTGRDVPLHTVEEWEEDGPSVELDCPGGDCGESLRIPRGRVDGPDPVPVYCHSCGEDGERRLHRVIFRSSGEE